MNSIPPIRSLPIAPAPRVPAARPAAKSAPAAAPTPAASATPMVPAAPETPDILTAEEREFFEAQAALGLLTYRPRSAAAGASAPPTGQRIDVRG